MPSPRSPIITLGAMWAFSRSSLEGICGVSKNSGALSSICTPLRHLTGQKSGDFNCEVISLSTTPATENMMFAGCKSILSQWNCHSGSLKEKMYLPQ